MNVHTQRDMIRNEVIRGKVEVASVTNKMRERRLRWFMHVKRRCKALVKIGWLQQEIREVNIGRRRIKAW